jgi:FkbM family methyltransferase
MEPKPSPISTALLRAARWYSRHIPLQKGKAPLQQALVKFLGPVELTAQADGAGEFLLRFPEDSGWEALYFEGTFETGTSRALLHLIRPDDVVFDIGANIGWFTILLAKKVIRGTCHAFEPQPSVFDRLCRVCALNKVENRVVLNQLALGDHEGSVELYSFKHLGSGHASMSSLGRNDFTATSVPLLRVDTYLSKQGVSKVDLIKIDVEGAELGVLRGAQTLLHHPDPPIWILEMNIETAKVFGYVPADLLRLLQENGNYRFYRVVQGWGEVVPMKTTTDYEHADNVICVPESRWDRLSFLSDRPGKTT